MAIMTTAQMVQSIEQLLKRVESLEKNKRFTIWQSEELVEQGYIRYLNTEKQLLKLICLKDGITGTIAPKISKIGNLVPDNGTQWFVTEDASLPITLGIESKETDLNDLINCNRYEKLIYGNSVNGFNDPALFFLDVAKHSDSNHIFQHALPCSDDNSIPRYRIKYDESTWGDWKTFGVPGINSVPLPQQLDSDALGYCWETTIGRNETAIIPEGGTWLVFSFTTVDGNVVITDNQNETQKFINVYPGGYIFAPINAIRKYYGIRIRL